MKNRVGKCAICGQPKKLSYEHVPPQSAFNNNPIFVQGYSNLIDESSILFGKKMKNNKGFGEYTLCENCNNNTGSWYGKAFCDFAYQGMEILKNNIDDSNVVNYAIKGSYKIKPLNVVKQIISMFFSADKSGVLQNDTSLVEFILDKNKQTLPDRYRIFLYSTMAPNKRMIGYSVVYNEKGLNKWSEITFQPFGYLLTDDSVPAHGDMCDITSFSNLQYNQEIVTEITTPYLQVKSFWIGQYD